MERPRAPTVVPLTKELIQQIGLLQQQQQRGTWPVNTTTSKAAALAGQGVPRQILPQWGKSGRSVTQQGQGAAAVNSVELGNQRHMHKGQESRAAISVQVLTNNALSPSDGSRPPQTVAVPIRYTYKVKI